MAEEEHGGDGANEDVKRRATFTPPPENAAFPENLGELSDEDIQAAKRASEAAANQKPVTASGPEPGHSTYQSVTPANPPPLPVPEPVAPAIPPAPTRSSLADEEIMAKFRDGAIPTTEGMMSALESQLSLRAEEDSRFAEWENTVRQMLPEPEARDLIAQARHEFGGLSPLEEPEPAVAAEPVVEHAMMDDSAESVPEPSNPLLAAMVADTDDQVEASVGDQAAAVEPPAEFDSLMTDADAVSPPTSQWPLVVDEHTDSGLDAEPADPEVPGALSDESDLAEEDSASVNTEGGGEPQPFEEPSVVSSGVAVGTDTVRISDVVAAKEPATDSLQLTASERERWFAFDRVGIEPAADVNRTSGVLQLFWTWWAASVPLAGVIIGAWLIAAGNSFFDALFATATGVVIGSLPLLAGTVAGVRWGLPTLIASRAAFGLAGNIFPAAVMLIIRLGVSAFFVWAAVWVASGVYVEANLWRLERVALDVILTTVAVVIVGALVMAGRRFVSLMLWTSAGLSLIAAAVLVFLTWEVPTRSSLSGSGADLPLLVSSASLVAAILLVLWSQSGADVARFARPGKAAAKTSMVGVAALLPPIVLIGWGALLAASGESWWSGVLADPFDQVLTLAPAWYPIPAVVVLAIPLLGLAALALHSSSYALMSLGFSITRYISAAVVTVVAAGIVFVVLLLLGDPSPYLVDILRVTGVVVAAWTGVFVADMVTRRQRLAPGVLLGTKGAYPLARVAPLAGFIVAVAVGWGFTVSNEAVFGWLGFIVGPLTNMGLVDLAPYQLGVVVALVLSFAVAAFAGIRGGVLTGADSEKAPGE